MSGVQISLPRPLYLLGLIDMKMLVAAFVSPPQPSHILLALMISNELSNETSLVNSVAIAT